MAAPSTSKDKLRVLNTVSEMLIDRGYPVNTEDICENAKLFTGGESSSFSYIVENTTKLSTLPAKIAIIWESQFVVKTVRNYEQFMYDNDVVNAIFITDNVLNIYAKKALKELSNTNNPRHKKVTVFFSYELVVNITHHPWVPFHKGLSPSEEKIVMSKYRLTKKQFPRISINDPVSRYYGYIRGQILKITRLEYHPKTKRLISTEVTFRVVV